MTTSQSLGALLKLPPPRTTPHRHQSGRTDRLQFTRWWFNVRRTHLIFRETTPFYRISPPNKRIYSPEPHAMHAISLRHGNSGSEYAKKGLRFLHPLEFRYSSLV